MRINERKMNVVPRTLNKALRIPRSAKDATRHVRKATDDIQERQHENPTQFAVNAIEERGREAAQKGVQEALLVGKRGVRDGLERGKEAFMRSINQSRENAHQPMEERPETESPRHLQADNPPQPQTQARANQATRTREQARYALQEQGRAQFKQESIRNLGADQARSTEQATVRTRQGLDNLRDMQGAGDRSFSFASDTIQASRNVKHSARKSADRGKRIVRTVKTAGRCVKTATRSVKAGARTIKTTKAAAQVAAKTAKVTQNTVAMARQLAIKTAKATVVAVKAAVKATVTTVKALIALIKALFAAIAAGGWAAIVIILVFGIVAAILLSPIGIFYGAETGEGRPMPEIISEIRSDLRGRIEAIKAENAADIVVIDYEGDDIICNWRDVIAVFAVKTATDPENSANVLILDNEKIARLKEVFWDMNELSYSLSQSEQVQQSQNPDGTTRTEVKTVNTLTISISSKFASQMSIQYGFSQQQKEMLNTLLSAEFRPMMSALLGFGEGSVSHLTPEQLAQIYNDLPSGTIGGDIVKFALEHLGDSYSERDCSAFVRYCYAQFGIELPRTAAEQGQYCYQNSLTISPDDLVPGDLIFFSHDTNGRFLEITHVAIYAGNGMVVDSSSSRGEVVYRSLYSGAVLWGRPHLQ